MQMIHVNRFESTQMLKKLTKSGIDEEMSKIIAYNVTFNDPTQIFWGQKRKCHMTSVNVI